MAASHLRPVKPGEKAKKPLTVVEAAERGTHRELLVALRDRVAKTVGDPNCPPRDLAALSLRLQHIAKEIAALDAAEEDDDIGHAAATEDEGWQAI